MNKCISGAAVVIALLNTSACAAACKPLDVRSMRDVHVEVDNALVPARAEYLFGDTKQSVTFLLGLTDVYARTQCTSVVPEEARQAFRHDEMLDRARLARQYQKLGDTAKAAAETEKAVQLGRVVLSNPSFTAGDLSVVLDRMDANLRRQAHDAASSDPD